jgi:hypothetical protein
MKALFVLPLLLLPTIASAVGELPTEETAFVDAVKSMKKDKITEFLGEPTSSMDVKDKRTGLLIGSIWNYSYINTSPEGDYYKTTELDFVGDRVETIVFSNEDEVVASEAVVEGECVPSC